MAALGVITPGVSAQDISNAKLAAADAELTARIKKDPTFCGGDAAYSISLSKNRTVWIFGDTFKYPDKSRKPASRAGCSMPRNSVAVDDPSAPEGGLEFNTGTKDFFKSPNKGEYFWPGDGIACNGKLLIFLHGVKDDKNAAPPFGFALTRNFVAVIENPHEEPRKWKYTLTDLEIPGDQILIGTAVMRSGDYLYLYNTKKDGGITVARVKFKELLKQNTASSIKPLMSYWDGTQWANNSIEPNHKADELFEGATEMSALMIRDEKGDERYQIFYVERDKPRILLRQAKHPQGPWSKAQTVYDFPPIKDVFFYSVKAHQEYASGSHHLPLTYCTNTGIEKKRMNDWSVYFPQALRYKCK